MAKALKRMLASQLHADLEDATGALIVTTGPMTVENSEAFRGDLREKAGGARLRIIHNRTARVALKQRWFDGEAESATDGLEEMLKGPTAIVFGGSGPISIAKVVRDWRKKWKPLEVKGAVSDGELLGKEDAEGLAELPDLPELRGMFLSALLGAPRGLAGTLSGVYGGLARCLKARVDDAGGDAEGDAASDDDAGDADAAPVEA